MDHGVAIDEVMHQLELDILLVGDLLGRGHIEGSTFQKSVWHLPVSFSPVHFIALKVLQDACKRESAKVLRIQDRGVGEVFDEVLGRVAQSIVIRLESLSNYRE